MLVSSGFIAKNGLHRGGTGDMVTRGQVKFRHRATGCVNGSGGRTDEGEVRTRDRDEEGSVRVRVSTHVFYEYEVVGGEASRGVHSDDNGGSVSRGGNVRSDDTSREVSKTGDGEAVRSAGRGVHDGGRRVAGNDHTDTGGGFHEADIVVGSRH